MAADDVQPFTDTLAPLSRADIDDIPDTQIVSQSQDDGVLPEVEVDEDGYVNWGELVPMTPGFASIYCTPEKESIQIGRHRSCDVCIAEAKISSRHCRIYRRRPCAMVGETQPSVYILDTSANGTFVDRVRLRKNKEYELQDGAIVHLVHPSSVESIAKNVFASFLFKRPPTVENITRLSQPVTQASLQDYQMVRKLGEGSFATVHEVICKRTGEHMALKDVSLRAYQMRGAINLRTVLREVEILKQIDHPSIVQLHEAFKTQDHLYMVMELVKGGELFDRLIDKGPYPEARAKILMHRLFSAVKYLHDRNIVHRDLKPENILVDDEDDTLIKVADLGVANVMQGTGLRTFVGSPQYFAPEVLERQHTKQFKGRYGKGADMWSLGVIMYVVLSCQPPFSEQALEQETLNKRLVNWGFHHPLWARVSADARHLIKNLMTAEERRLTIEEALQHEWFEDMPEECIIPYDATRSNPRGFLAPVSAAPSPAADPVNQSATNETRVSPQSSQASYSGEEVHTSATAVMGGLSLEAEPAAATASASSDADDSPAAPQSAVLLLRKRTMADVEEDAPITVTSPDKRRRTRRGISSANPNGVTNHTNGDDVDHVATRKTRSRTSKSNPAAIAAAVPDSPASRTRSRRKPLL